LCNNFLFQCTLQWQEIDFGPILVVPDIDVTSVAAALTSDSVVPYALLRLVGALVGTGKKDDSSIARCGAFEVC
jgi:hypothetical protein